jgi:sterol desaturase/sphingolipid hydroxylase (fatty acid hydroxylase superfamily)
MAVFERRWPVEPVTDRRGIGVDVIYTLIHRLGLFRLALFFTVEPAWDWAAGELRLAGLPTWHFDGLWPGVTDVAWVTLAIYLVVFDFVGYWLHRAEHQFNWWWGLHSLHHSQRQMTVWSDNRNHLLDDVIVATLFALLARVIGVEPGQFVAITVITKLLQSLQHANLRWSFGPVGERLLVSPRFHRRHHSIGIGHESAGKGTLGGHNFGILLPWWDMMFGTADFQLRFDATGVRDQLPEEGGRDYGRGFWQQQWLGLKRMVTN